MLFNRDLEYRCGLSKSIDSFDPNENNGVNEDPSILTDDPSILTDMDNDIHSWKNNSENDSHSHGDYLVDVSNIQNFLSDKTFLVMDSNRNSYSIDFAIENQILEIDHNHSFFNEPESFFASYQNYSYLTNVSKSNDPNYIDDTQCNWIKNINSLIESYLCYQICIASYILDDSDNYNANISDLNSYISDDTNDSDFDFTPIEYSNDTNNSKFTPIQYPDDPKDTSYTQQFKHLWVQCESCFGLNYKKFFKSKMNICKHCGDHLKMSNSDRIELSIDPGTWNPMDEDIMCVRRSAYARRKFELNLLYVAILTSPSTGGVTTSFGMLGDIIIAEPKAYLAFVGKRVIEQTLNKEVPEGSQSAEVFFEKGLLDSIVSRDSLKDFLSELFEFHGCFPWIENEN
ncbi:hypothetical protein RYX36_018194 [Vicia faba]